MRSADDGRATDGNGTRRWRPGLLAWTAACIVALASGLLGLALATPQAQAPGVSGFVTKSGDRLMLGDRVFRFSGPNIYWGGLDENGRASLNYPTPFRVQSALATTADLGGTVARCLTCGISTGNPNSVEPSLGTFSQVALQHIDYFVAQARESGIRLVVPLTDNYSYYLGGYPDFTNWLGLSAPANCPSAACASTFYTNPKAVAAFEQYISVLLNHVNVYTGVPNKDDPTIMSWELGNEMPYGTGGAEEFTRWTGAISAFIKSMAPDQLVADGAVTFDPGDLTLPDVDIQDLHLYPISTSYLDSVAPRVASAGQALIIGEYAWNNPSGLLPFLADVRRTASISGDLYWGLLPLNDDFGYVEHYDGYQLHFPGDGTDVAADATAPVLSGVTDAPLVRDLREHAYAMSGLRVPPYAVPAAPAITNVEHVSSMTAGDGNLVEWQGSAGAARYIVRRSSVGPHGPWTVVCASCSDPNGEPWLDPGAGSGPRLWYQVTAVNPDGVAGRGSVAFQVVNLTLDDNLSDFSLTSRHCACVRIDTADSSRYGGDPARASSSAGTPADGIVWRAAGVRSVEALGYYQDGEGAGMAAGHFRFLLSADGTAWRPVPDADVQVNWGFVAARGDRVPYLYTIDDVQRIVAGAEFVQVQWASNAAGLAELGEVRITYL